MVIPNIFVFCANSIIYISKCEYDIFFITNDFNGVFSTRILFTVYLGDKFVNQESRIDVGKYLKYAPNTAPQRIWPSVLSLRW